MGVIYEPVLKNWEIFFAKEDGVENRDNIAKAFARFLVASKDDVMKIPGMCFLGGTVFGRGCEYGNDILTPHVSSVERVKRGSHEVHGHAHDLICATTESGSKYYFYSDENNPWMSLMLSDIIRLGKLNTENEYYLNKKYRSRGVFI